MHEPDFTPAALPAPLRTLLLTWRACEGHRVPRLGTLPFHHIASTLDQLVITEVVRGEHSRPVDFRYIYISDGMRRILEDDPTGERFSRIDGNGPGSEIWAAQSATATSGEPHRVCLPYRGPIYGIEDTTELYLPLADETLRVGYVLAGVLMNSVSTTLPPPPRETTKTIPPGSPFY